VLDAVSAVASESVVAAVPAAVAFVITTFELTRAGAVTTTVQVRFVIDPSVVEGDDARFVLVICYV